MITLICAMFLVTLVGSERPTEEESKEVVEFFNRVRSNVNPSATDMNEVVYSLDLEKKAEEYAERCTLMLPENSEDSVFKHYQGFLGESTLSDRNFTKFLALWYSFHVNYTFANNSCGGICSFYQMMICSTLEGIGCGIKLCDSIEYGSNTSALIYVCLLTPWCPFRTMKPYFEGESCFDCPLENVCVNNLCSTTKAPTSKPQTTPTTTVTTSTSSAIWSGEMVSRIILLVYLSIH